MSGLESILYMILIVLIFVVIALAMAFFVIKKKEKESSEIEEKAVIEEDVKQTASSSIKIAKEYETKSVFDFMEFETVKDNMIVQKNGKRFLMAIECKGINYDLMSEVEKTATEQAFAEFLNTLKEPIQIYIQTRTVNLEKNILDYKEKVDKIKEEINLKEFKLKEYMSRGNINEKLLKNKQFELLRENNLYAYGADVVADTKKMSLNKNVLKKKYYIIIKYFYEAVDGSETALLSDDEIREVAFSSLYTKAASMIRVLSGIGIVGKTLNSFELVELLYNAYNRDDSEIFSIEKAIDSGYDEIYVDSQNVIDKKIEALNKEIQIRAQETAQEAIEKVMDERSKELSEIEENIDSIIEDLAKKVIEDEIDNIPMNIKEQAIEKIENKRKKKGVEETNGKQSTKESSKKRRAS